MKFTDLKSAIQFVQKNCPCQECKTRHKQSDISVLAATKDEVLLDLRCPKCKLGSVISVILEKEKNRREKAQEIEQSAINNLPGIARVNKISENDILDVKNFLSTFDGNFKKIFRQ